MLVVYRSNVLFHMMSFVQFPVILSKIIQQHGTYRFDEFKQAMHNARVLKHSICPLRVWVGLGVGGGGGGGMLRAPF
jgi:hypothetical protein